jgi:hypothetical protein
MSQSEGSRRAILKCYAIIQPQSELKEPALMKNIKSRDSALAGMKMLTVAGVKTTGGTGERQMPVQL